MWSSWGLLAGLFQDVALTFSFLAIPRVGLSIGQGVWGGASILMSILLGITVSKNEVTSVVSLVFALLILLASIGGIAFCNEIGFKFSQLHASKHKTNITATNVVTTSVNDANSDMQSISIQW